MLVARPGAGRPRSLKGILLMRRSVLLCSTVFAGLVLSVPAFAQSTSTDTSKAKDAAQDVVVTGSRIKRNSFTAPDPIQVITSEQASLSGYSDTASLLQQSSIATGTFQTGDQLTGYVTTGGAGNKTLALSRLGPQRTIILLDGKRLGPAGISGTVGPVSLDVIPDYSIDHVEVLRDGASSIYGSDAVAGVVNIITKKNRDGGDLSAYTSQSQHGGGNAYSISGDWAKTFDRGYVTLGGQYFEQERLARGQRDYLNCSEDYLFNPATGARVDYPDAVGPNYNHFYKCYNSSNNDIATVQYGTITYTQPGINYPTAAQGNNVPGTPAASFGGAPLNTIFARQARAGYPLTYPYASYYTPVTDRVSAVSPDAHYTFNANLGYDFNSTTHLYGQLLFNDRISTQMGARQYFPGSGAAGNALNAAFTSGNPNNPFIGTGVTPIYPIIELPYDSHQNVKYYRGVIGLKGDFTNLGWFNRFSYDVSGVYSRSDADYSVDQIYLDRTDALTNTAAPCTTVGINNVSNYSCANLPNGIPLFSQRVLAGNFTQAERNFLFFKAHGSTTYDQYILEGSVTGDLFTLPAGSVGVALGVSYRHDHIDDTPDPQVQAGNSWGFSAAGHTVGSDAVKEVYGELTIPVIKNVPGIQSLNFDVSGRYSDYDSYGSTSTYKVAGNWTVIPDLRFRGSVGTSFRAPALYELYLAHQTSFSGQSAVDPCYNYGTNAPAAKIQQACAALGIPNNYIGAQNPGGGSSATISTGGGIGNLKAETSQAKSIGVVFQPKHFGIDRWTNLAVSLDYTDIQVHNEVNTFGSYNIISQCLQGNTAFCGLFVRDLNPASPTYFNIISVNNNYVNVAKQGVRFMDANVHMDHNFGRFGRLGFEAKATWTFSDKTTLLGGGAPTNYNGGTYNYDAPDVSGEFNVQYDLGDWTVFWRTVGIGKGSDAEFIGYDTTYFSRYSDVANGITSNNCAATPNACVKYKFHTEASFYHTISVRKRLPALNAEVTVGVNNIFDQNPPLESTGEFRIGQAAIGYPDAELIGRSFFARITKKW